MTGPPVQTNSLTAQHSTTAHHPEMYYRYGPLVTMKSPVIGLHLTIKTDLLQRIILPKIDWPSYSMPRELIGMVKAEIMALEMQEAESAYMDRRVEKYAIMMRFNLTNRFMSSKWPSTLYGITTPVFFSWDFNVVYSTKHEATMMVCCGISDSPLVSSHAYRLRSNRHRPFAKEVSQLVDEYESAAVKYLIERLNLKTVVDSMSAESLYHTPLRGMNLQYLRNNALRPLLLECLNDHCDSDQFDCHTPWEWVDPRLLR